MTVDWPALVSAAWAARERAYAPYSQYRVGAALLAEDGRVFVGANVENASYGLCLCAERTAMGTAITAGARRFAAIAVVTGGAEPGTPCGMCRQVLSELAHDVPVRCVAESGAMIDSTTSALLPLAFTPAALGVDTDRPRATMLEGTSNERLAVSSVEGERPAAEGVTSSTAFAGVALKVAAGTGAELAEAHLGIDDPRSRK